jgi:hypothetical protein
MNRRSFHKLTGLTALSAMFDGVGLHAQTNDGRQQASPFSGSEVVLEDDEVIVAFDRSSGALTRLERKSTGWAIHRRRELGVSFRLSVPLPKQRTNFVLGGKQKAEKVEKVARGEVRIVWRDPVSEHGGTIPLVLVATVMLEKGELRFEATLTNNSAHMIETVDYPYLGDLTSTERGRKFVAHHMFVGALQEMEIHPYFSNALGYWGVRYPTKTINSNVSQFCLLQAEGQGIYVGAHDPAIRYLLQFTFEQHPGTVDWVSGEVPLEDTISGLPVHLDFRLCHFVFAHPQSTTEFVPVVLKPYNGDWHHGLDEYRNWRETWFARAKVPAWTADVHSWLQLQIDGAEQDYSIPYKDLVQYGQECADNGVSAIQLVGWNHGGQDGGDPSLDTDPGLGSWQELKNAIDEIQAKGVKIILFGKPIFADMSTEYYRRELHKYEATDMYGNKYESGGYSYETPTQLAGINNRRRAIMDVCCQAYRDIATHEFEKTVKLGASGWLFDEVMQHNGVLYNFSEDHGYRAPGYLFSADIPLAKQFRAAADRVNREFLFSGEGPGDWLMPYYVLGYYRIGAGTRHALRYIDPRAPLMAAVRGWNARDEINLTLAYRYIISYEPYNFKGHVTDFPLTLAYGKKVDALRRRYREYLWDADFRDTLGATVTAKGDLLHSVFVTSSGKRAFVVVNLEQTESLAAELSIPNPGTLSVVTPEHPERQETTGNLSIPPRSVAVVLEG